MRSHPIFIARRKKVIAKFDSRDSRRPEKRRDPINENIRYPKVRVIGPDGEQLGVMSSYEANGLAMRYNLDLYCVAPNAEPPVCKIVNYGKLRYEKDKQERLSKKNQKKTELKQIQLSPVIGQHDIAFKAKQARNFIEEGNKVEIVVIFKGRQLSHKEIGEEVLHKFIALIDDIASVSKEPYWEGKWYKAIYAPKTTKQKKEEKSNAENEN